ncbi:MAG: hypothetical protein WBD99_03795 [Thermodesulfobacteriota bacterium]
MDPRIEKVLNYVEKCYDLTSTEKKRLLERLWTFSSKVRQPRKDDRSCNKTPYFDRWDTNSSTSYLNQNDPRYATREECENVLLTLLVLLLEASDISFDTIREDVDLDMLNAVLEREFRFNNLKCLATNEAISKEDIKKSLTYATQRLGSFDISTDYINDLSDGGLHRHDNVGWIKPFHINHKLRKILKDEFVKAGGNSKSAKKALDKIQVKAYCTDKFTMPPHFSNRDIRWATWPDSNQYASHYECCMIELELMCQVFEFAGAPRLESEIRTEIQEKRRQTINENARRCYITGKEMNFTIYLQGAISPKGGKSAYHVSHVNPLTRGGKHNHINVEWITEDGNRIQGNDTLEEIEEKLIDAVTYYLERNHTFLPSTTKNLSKLRELLSIKTGK